MTNSISDQFGFLPVEEEMAIDGWVVRPLGRFAEEKRLLDTYAHQDGFLYPCESQSEARDGQRIARTTRPQRLFHMPASHSISTETDRSLNDIRRHDGAFLIHFLGMLFGFRLQFHDWWLDGRVPLKSMHNLYIHPAVANDCAMRCYRTWSRWTEPIQRWMTNLMYMHGRGPMYEWDWESFLIECTVFDGCLRIAKEVGGFKTPSKSEQRSHRDALCDHFGLAVNTEILRRMMDLRNELVHESLWAGGQPCSAEASDAFMAPRHLHRLNHRLLLALLGYRNGYSKTAWWSLSSARFDIADAVGID